eukprot:c24013_g1_i2 orf=100-495(+)
MASQARDWWSRRRQEADRPLSRSFMIGSPHENGAGFTEASVKPRRNCTDEGFKAGLRAGGIACVASAIPTLVSVRVIPWAKANINYTGQALIVSAATISSYFIVCDKTILKCARETSYERIEAERAAKEAS